MGAGVTTFRTSSSSSSFRATPRASSAAATPRASVVLPLPGGPVGKMAQVIGKEILQPWCHGPESPKRLWRFGVRAPVPAGEGGWRCLTWGGNSLLHGRPHPGREGRFLRVFNGIGSRHGGCTKLEVAENREAAPGGEGRRKTGRDHRPR